MHLIIYLISICRNKYGEWYVFSFGGYHADDDQRTVRQADSVGGPVFSSQPIDVQFCDCGWLLTAHVYKLSSTYMYTTEFYTINIKAVGFLCVYMYLQTGYSFNSLMLHVCILLGPYQN